jgi:hypothetical protein
MLVVNSSISLVIFKKEREIMKTKIFIGEIKAVAAAIAMCIFVPFGAMVLFASNPANIDIQNNPAASSVQMNKSAVSSTENIEYSRLKEAIAKAYQIRLAALTNSSGSAEMVIEITKSWSLEQDKEIRGTKKAEWSTKWYNKGQKQRYEMTVGARTGTEFNGRSLFSYGSFRAIVDPNRRVLYKVDSGEAAIDSRIQPASNPWGLTVAFDIKRLYQCDSRFDLPGLLNSWDKNGNKPVISEEKIGETRCIKIEFNSERTETAGQIRKFRLELWLAPKQSYSLIKAQSWTNSYVTGTTELRVLESYEATYEESKDVKGVWLLKELTIGDYQIPNIGWDEWVLGDGEKLKVKFSDTKVGIDIPEETFALERLGIPNGTMVYNNTGKVKVIGSYNKGFIIENSDSKNIEPEANK